MSSPTARTLSEAANLGYEAEVVEKTIHVPGGRTFKRDLFGVIDVLAVSATETLGIQASSGDHHAHRRDKALAEKRLAIWLALPGRRFEIWTFAKRRTLGLTKAGKRGRRKVWTLRREEITLAMFVPTQPAEQPREAIT